jgi:hypothetical protein
VTGHGLRRRRGIEGRVVWAGGDPPRQAGRAAARNDVSPPARWAVQVAAPTCQLRPGPGRGWWTCE